MIHPRVHSIQEEDWLYEDYLYNITKQGLYYDFLNSVPKERKPNPKRNRKATKKYADGRQKGRRK